MIKAKYYVFSYNRSAYFAMAEYRNALIRNGLIAIIISSLIIGVAFYGSGQIANRVGPSLPGSMSSPSMTSTGTSSITTTHTTSSEPTSTSTPPMQNTTSTSTSTFTSSTSSSTTTSSSSGSYSSTSSSLGGVQLLSVATGAYCCVYATYDSPNSTIYATGGPSSALWQFKNGTFSTAIFANNYSLAAMTGISSNSQNGHVYVLNEAPGGNSCCSAWITEVSGQAFVSQPVPEFGISSNVLFDPQNGYVYFGIGGGGACTANENGIQVAKSSNISQNVGFIQLGPQPQHADPCSVQSAFTPVKLALDSSNGAVYVAAYSSRSNGTMFYVLSGTTLERGVFNVSGAIVDLVFNPSNGYLYSEQLVNQTMDSNDNLVRGSYVVNVIDTSTNSIVGSVILGSSNAQLVYDSHDNNVYAFGKDQINVISGTSTSATYPEPQAASVLSVVYDASSNEFVAFDAGKSIVTTSSTTVTTSSNFTTPNTIATIPVGLGSSVAYDPSGKVVYAITSNGSQIEEINGSTNSLLGNIKFTCGAPYDLAFDSHDGLLYATYSKNPTNCSDQNTTLIGMSANSIKTVIDIPSARYMAFDSKDNTLFVEGLNATHSPVILVYNASSGKLVKTINSDFGFLPMGYIWGPMLYDPVNGLLYYEWSTPGANNNYYDGTILNATSYANVGTFDPYSGDMPPSSMTYNPINGLVYIAREGSGGCIGYNNCNFNGGQNVTVINGTSIVGYIPISSNENSTLSSIAYTQGTIFVVNGTHNSNVWSLTWINGSSFHSETLAFQPTAIYADQANPSYLYVFGSTQVYVIKVN